MNINGNEIFNPLSDLISDEVYELLSKEGLIDEKGVRDYLIQTKFREMRSAKINTTDAFGVLQKEFPNLGFDSINKIVYQKKR